MLITIILTLSFLAVLLEFFRTNPYISRFYAIFPLFFLFSAIAFNRMSRDYLAYEYMFKNIEYKNSLERGYRTLIDLVMKYNGGHETIVFLAACFFLFVLLKLMRQTSDLNLVIFGYTGYSLIYDITQTRNFIMYLIISLTPIFVYEKKPIQYFVSVIVASQFHLLALFYLPFYFISKIKKEKFEKIMILILIILIILSPYLMELFVLLFPDKSNYAHKTPSNGVYINYLFVLLDLIEVYLVKKFSSGLIPEDEEKKLSTFYKFVWLSIVIIPFSSYFLEIIRIQRNAQLIKYVFIAKSFKYLSFDRKLIIFILIVTNVLLSFWILSMTGNIDLINFVDYNAIKSQMDILFFS